MRVVYVNFIIYAQYPTNSSQSDTLQVKSHFLVQYTNLVGEFIFLNNYAQNYYTDFVTCG